jgi:hypothetical protein
MQLAICLDDFFVFSLCLDSGGGLSILPFDEMSARIAFPSKHPVFLLPHSPSENHT